MQRILLLALLGLVIGSTLRITLGDGNSVTAEPSNPDDIVDPADWQESLSYEFTEVYDGTTLTSEQEAVSQFDSRYVRDRIKTHTATRLTTLADADQMVGAARNYGFRGIPEAEQPVWVIAATIDGGVSPTELGMGVGTEKLPGVYTVLNAGNGEPLTVSFLDHEGKWLGKIEALANQELRVEPAPRLVP